MTFKLEELDTVTISHAEPMTYRIETAHCIYPSPCRNVDGIGLALEQAAEALTEAAQDYEDEPLAFVWHGPVQDDEHPDVAEASFRLSLSDGRVWVEALDTQALFTLQAARNYFLRRANR